MSHALALALAFLGCMSSACNGARRAASNPAPSPEREADPLAEFDARVPRYHNRQRDFLSAAELRGVRAAIDGYAGIQRRPGASPELRFRALEGLIHALVLAGNDRRYRGFDSEADALFARVLSAAEDASSIYTADPWVPYKQGIAATGLGQDALASTCFSKAIERARGIVQDPGRDPAEVEQEADILSRARFEHACSLIREGRLEPAERELLELRAEAQQRHLESGIDCALGHLLALRGALDEAIARFEAAADEVVEEGYAIEPQLWICLLAEQPEPRAKAARWLRKLAESYPFEEMGMQWEQAVIAALDRPDSGDALLRALADEELRRHGSVAEIAALRVRAWFVIARLPQRSTGAIEQVERCSGGRFSFEALHARARLRRRGRQIQLVTSPRSRPVSTSLRSRRVPARVMTSTR